MTLFRSSKASGGRTSDRATRLAKIRGVYDSVANDYDRRWSRYVEVTVRESAAELDPHPGERLLDVGCGTGTLLTRVEALWPESPPFGIDLSPRMLAVARGRVLRTRLVRSEAGALPFRDAAFGTVVSVSSLHYWPDPVRALDELTRVLRTGGRLVLTDWCGDDLPVRLSDFLLRHTQKAHRRALRSGELRFLLERRGFHVSMKRYRAGWWGLMTATATLGRQASG